MHRTHLSGSQNSHTGFSLIEVVLAIGIFLVTVLALVGLLGPTLQSVDDVEKTDEIASVVNTVNAFLQSSPEIATRDAAGVVQESKFEVIYEALASDSADHATLFVYRYYTDPDDPDDPPVIQMEVGFSDSEPVGDDAIVNNPASNPASFTDATGSIYRVVLTASSVTPEDHRSGNRDPATNTYTLSKSFETYPEGYLAMEARIFAEDPPAPGGAAFDVVKTLEELVNVEPIFTYNTAIVR